MEPQRLEGVGALGAAGVGQVYPVFHRAWMPDAAPFAPLRFLASVCAMQRAADIGISLNGLSLTKPGETARLPMSGEGSARPYTSRHAHTANPATVYDMSFFES